VLNPDIQHHHRTQISAHFNKLYNFTVRLESNGYPDPYGQFEWLLAGAQTALVLQMNAEKDFWQSLQEISEKNDFKIVTLAYDLKNINEKLESENSDPIGFPEACVWKPEVMIALDRTGTLICKGIENLQDLLETVCEQSTEPIELSSESGLQSPEFDKYNLSFKALHNHILRGDIYEVNLCRQESTIVKYLKPEQLFGKLNLASPAPFSCLFKVEHLHLICTSPERFLRKKDSLLVSQPIKGTSRRFPEPELDFASAESLRNNPKEQSENVMIVDLVRNDLSHFAAKGSVRVKELFGIYKFPKVFQMISTIEADLENESDGIRALAAAFPMGSMTGAPKISAMKLIDKYETFKRGIYSGACGYLTESGDYDFNVVIRSFVWNEKSGMLCLAAGSAITLDAEARSEFDECRLKAEALWNSIFKP